MEVRGLHESVNFIIESRSFGHKELGKTGLNGPIKLLFLVTCINLINPKLTRSQIWPPLKNSNSE